jgi:hypothetical protein
MKPDPKLIDSMAMRYRHDFGLLDETQKESIRITMTQLWEEVVGLGFYKADVICCGFLERMQLGWMKLEDGSKCMPYIKGHSDENMYRVNNCPSCGKHIRDVMVKP